MVNISTFNFSGSLSYDTITAAPPPGGGITPVPTLSEWGLLILALGVGLVGVIRIYRFS